MIPPLRALSPSKRMHRAEPSTTQKVGKQISHPPRLRASRRRSSTCPPSASADTRKREKEGLNGRLARGKSLRQHPLGQGPLCASWPAPHAQPHPHALSREHSLSVYSTSTLGFDGLPIGCRLHWCSHCGSRIRQPQAQQREPSSRIQSRMNFSLSRTSMRNVLFASNFCAHPFAVC